MKQRSQVAKGNFQLKRTFFPEIQKPQTQATSKKDAINLLLFSGVEGKSIKELAASIGVSEGYMTSHIRDLGRHAIPLQVSKGFLKVKHLH